MASYLDEIFTGAATHKNEVAFGPCLGNAGDLGGIVFLDVDNDGINDSEVGQAGIVVTVFDGDGNEVTGSPTTTDTNGAWTITGLTDGDEYRVEFSTPGQPYLQPSFAGADNGTSTQFVTAPSCEINYGVVDANLYCQEDPDIVITCFVNGDPSSTDAPADVVLTYPQSRAGVDLTAADYASPTVLITKNQAGSVWGMAYDRDNREVYVSAFLKRHVGLLETDPVTGAPLNNPLAAIFRTSVDGSGARELFVDLSTLGIDVGTIPDNAARGVNVAPNSPSTDAQAYGLIGKVGLGDIVFDEETRTLYAVNLFEKTLLTIPVNPDGTAGTVTSTTIPDPGCVGGEVRPFAVEVYQNSVYLGTVCDAATSEDVSDLLATVYRHDAGTFTALTSFPLDYVKGNPARSNCGPFTDWSFWSDVFPSAPCRIINGSNRYLNPQPILSNIDFDVDGSMILSFIDRFSHQLGYRNADLNDPPEGTNFIQDVQGEILRVARLTDGSYVLENNGVAGNLTSAEGVDNRQGPGGGEFYFGEIALAGDGSDRIAHHETGLGASALNPATGVLTSAVIRPGANRISTTAGTANFNASDGSIISGYTLFRGDNGQGIFGKGGGLGDLVLACDPLPIQIGNYVWVDEDEDGVQDAREAPLEGLPVSLYLAENTPPTLVANTATGADGAYYFTGDGTAGETWVNSGASLLRNTDYLIVFGDTPESGTTFMYDNVTYTLSQNDMGEGSNPDLNDSDATFQTSPLGNLPTISYRTTDETDHTLEVGLVCTAGVDVVVPGPFSICTAQPIDLTAGTSISPATTGGTWSTPDGSLAAFDTGTDFATATTYTPTAADVSRGSVTLVLTSNGPAGPCGMMSRSVTVQILQADCGAFMWGGN